jgi:serine/threonine protein kinase
MRRTSSCLEHAELECLLGDSLSDHDRRSAEQHVEECHRCQAKLESLTSGEGDWPERVQDLGQARAVESPSLERVIGALKDEFAAEHAAGSRAPAANQAEILHFLDPPESPGDLGKFGPYRVLQVLGQGGMGLVLRAFDPGLNRPIAIKVLAPQLAASGAARMRFLREARAAAAIRDEHVVAIHAVDEWKGLPYLVMELVPGISLQERLDRTAALDVTSILRIGMQTARGLAAAHDQGLVHRDIKPSNILLENGVERVKLTDFGLARAVDDATLTQSGVVAGTPLFMAPEQARGETMDHRADLFSLGAVMYSMCTGRPPFRASTTLGVLRRVCDDEHRPIREINPEIPDWLAEIIDRLLAKDRRVRFQSAREVARVLGDRLARWQRGPAAAARAIPVSFPQPVPASDDVGPAKGGSNRHGHWLWPLLAIASLLLVLVVMALGFASASEWLAAVPGIHESEAVLEVIATEPHMELRVDGFPVKPSPIGLKATDRFLFQVRLLPGWHHVEGYRDERKIDGYQVRIRPGRSLSLRFKGSTEAIDEPRAALSDPLRHQADTEHLKRSRDVLAAARERVEDQVKRVAWAEELLKKRYVSQQTVEQEKRRLETLNVEVVVATSRMIDAEREMSALQPVDEQQLREQIEELFRTDPIVLNVIDEIHKVRLEIERLKAVAASPQDPALVAARRRYQELNREYVNIWSVRSEELRKSLTRDRGHQN